MRIVDRVAYINHDIDDAIRYGILSDADLPRGGNRSPRLDRLGADRPHSSTTSWRPPSGRGHRAERGDRRSDALASQRSCSIASTSGPRSSRSTGARTTSSRTIFARLLADPEPTAGRRGELADRVTDYISGMTDRFALAYAGRPVVARIKDQSVRDVVAASNIVEVVGLRTSLRKSSGTRYMGRCPFHEERSPSFSVNADLNVYHCFGCGKGGDVVTFVRETEGLDFVGAIEWLAERFRVPLEYEESSPMADESRRRRERLFAVLDQAAAFFERHLWEGSDGSPFGPIWPVAGSPRRWRRSFGSACRQVGSSREGSEKGFTAEELRAAGLTNQRGGDYFPPRLMFPLADARGRVIGFQARKLHEDDPLKGKYVNSPESELFKKSNVLYGLHLARPAIAKQDRAVVVEGNTDVIALRQAGFEPVVASMGTALTEHHLRELARLTRRLYLCFDADAAGEEATFRGMERAHGQGFEIGVVVLPPGQDPADAPDGFEQRLAQAEGYLHYRVRLAVERAANREDGFEQARSLLAGQPASPERDDAVRLAAGLLGLPPGTQARSRRPGRFVAPRLGCCCAPGRRRAREGDRERSSDRARCARRSDGAR